MSTHFELLYGINLTISLREKVRESLPLAQRQELPAGILIKGFKSQGVIANFLKKIKLEFSPEEREKLFKVEKDGRKIIRRIYRKVPIIRIIGLWAAFDPDGLRRYIEEQSRFKGDPKVFPKGVNNL